MEECYFQESYRLPFVQNKKREKKTWSMDVFHNY